jgi:hypothetical protein
VLHDALQLPLLTVVVDPLPRQILAHLLWGIAALLQADRRGFVVAWEAGVDDRSAPRSLPELKELSEMTKVLPTTRQESAVISRILF